MTSIEKKSENHGGRAMPVNKRPSLAASALMVLAITLGVNVICGFVRVRADLTEENLHTLTAGTKSILDKLEDELIIKYYFSRSLGNVPRQFYGIKSYGQKVEELLQEYDNSSRNVTVQIVDVEPDSEHEEDATKYGIQGIPLPTGEKFYMGMVALYTGNEKVVPVFDPTRVEYMEYDITRTLDEVRKTTLPKVGVLAGLPVVEVQGMPMMQMPGMPQPQPGWLFMKELAKTYKVETIEPNAEKLPADLNLLMVIHPKNLPEKLVYAIDQFVVKGGHVIVMVDPYSRSDETQPPPGGNPMMGADKSSDLNRLLGKWGAEVAPDKIASSKKFASTVSAGPEGQVSLPTWIGLTGDEGLNKDSVISGKLESLRFIEPGSIQKKTVEGVELVPLVKVGGQTGEMNTFDLQFAYIENTKKIAWKEEERVLVGILNGKFKSTFEKAPEGVDTKENAFVKDGTTETSVMIIADTDFIADDYWVNQMNFFGQTLVRPLNDNFNLVANAIEFLSGTHDLISIRSRGKFERPFTLVKKLQQDAQEKWQAEEQRLVQKLQEAEEGLTKLTGAKVEEGRLILTPEIEEQIKKFRDEQVKTRQQLRAVRRDLRRDVDSLGKWITFVNVAVIPVLVAVFGVWFISRRRR